MLDDLNINGIDLVCMIILWVTSNHAIIVWTLEHFPEPSEWHVMELAGDMGSNSNGFKLTPDGYNNMEIFATHDAWFIDSKDVKK